MSRLIHIAAAQLGPIARNDSRPQVVERLLVLMYEAHRRGCKLVVYPELALTTFFPRWYFSDETELMSFFEPAMPNPEVQPLFEAARRLRMGFCLGYGELERQEGGSVKRYNSALLVDERGQIIGNYRKVHLPGHAEQEPWRRFQHLEKRYFTPGAGFNVWNAFGGRVGIMICNDRRWPESYRLMGLQGVELILLGYNTPTHNPPAPEHDRLSDFHNHLVMQAGAYQNGTWVVGVAKAGSEEGVHQIGGSCIIAPSGEIVARASGEEDELITACCDLDLCASYKNTVFNFQRHRRPSVYRPLAQGE